MTILDDNEIKFFRELGEKGFLKGVELSPWIVVDGHCATRVVLGTDPNEVSNRRAFIEKSPRVLISEDALDSSNWEYGPKGSGGSDGHIPENEHYGFYPNSRKWCDEALVLMGAVLLEEDYETKFKI